MDGQVSSPFIGALLLADGGQNGDEIQGQAQCADVIPGGEELHLAPSLGWRRPGAGWPGLCARLHMARMKGAPWAEPQPGAGAEMQHLQANLGLLQVVI